MEDSSRPPAISRTVASPFGGMENWFTDANVKKRDDEIRMAIYSALAIGALCLLSIGAYVSLIVLEPFLIPLFWALLTGFVLFPYKALLTESLKNFLRNTEVDEPALLMAIKSAPRAFNLCCDAMGEYLLIRNVKVLLSAFFLLPLGYYVYEYCFHLSWALELIDYVLNIWRVLGQVTTWPVLLSLLAGYLTCIALLPTNQLYQKVFLMVYCNLVWTVVGCCIFHTLPLPIFYFALVVMSAILYLGASYPDAPSNEEEVAAAPLTLLKNYVLGLLKSFSNRAEESEEVLLASSSSVDELKEDEEDKEMTEKVESEEQESKDIVSSTPFLPSNEEKPPSKVSCMETPITYPGISALRRGQLSGRGSSKLYGSSSIHRRKPRRVLVCRRDSTLGLLPGDESNISYLYISWVLWACCIIQLWVHPILLHLLPLPLACFVLKRLMFYLEFNNAIEEKLEKFCSILSCWYKEKEFCLLPHPFRYFGRMYFNAEKRAIQLLPEFADVVVTGSLILCLIFVILITGIFVSFQLYHECMYIVQTSGEVVSQLSNSTILGGLGLFEGAESYMETAYTQGRSYISNFLKQNTISDKDNGEFEQDVLMLFDRMYQYWLDRNNIGSGAKEGPRMDEDALASTVEDIASKVKSNFSFAVISNFAQENMGMITSVLEHSWALVKGNVGIVISLLFELIRVLLTSGSGLFNFIIGLVVYFTALFYLLSASDRTYIPLVVISELSVNGDGFAIAMNKAIKSVFIITFKMASFYGLWTYLTHTLFSASIVMVPVLAATFLAAVPVAGQYLVAIPAALELIFAKGRIASAVFLVLCHFAPMCLVDASIYAEVKRGIHPWITGLSIVGGIYCFGVPGAIYGPLIVCAVYVVLTVYTGFMAIEHPVENIGSTTAKTPNFKRWTKLITRLLDHNS